MAAMKAIVIGAGISGMLVARELRLAGWDVDILERGDVGRESSWAGGGIISPLNPWRYPDAVNRLAQASQEMYPALAACLARDTGIDPELLDSGMLVFVDEEQQALAQQWGPRFGQHVESVSADQVATIEPAAAMLASRALWMPAVRQVRNPRLLQALAQDLRQRGVMFHTQSPVDGFVQRGGRIAAVSVADRLHEADVVVAAGGAWTSQLLCDVAPGIEIEPVRGQMLLYKTEPGLLQRMVMHESRYVIPRRDGHVLVGSTLEKVGFDKVTTQAAAADLRAAAERLVPALRDAPIVKHWAGLRPGTEAGIPYIGPHPSISGLYVNAGHFRNGVVLGPASARLLADQILLREPLLPAEPYAVRAAASVDIISQ